MKTAITLLTLILCLGCATQAEQESAYIARDAATHLLKENPLDLRRQVVKSTIAQTINRIGKPSSSPVVPDWNTPSEVILLRKEIAAREAGYDYDMGRIGENPPIPARTMLSHEWITRYLKYPWDTSYAWVVIFKDDNK